MMEQSLLCLVLSALVIAGTAFPVGHDRDVPSQPSGDDSQSSSPGAQTVQPVPLLAGMGNGDPAAANADLLHMLGAGPGPLRPSEQHEPMPQGPGDPLMFAGQMPQGPLPPSGPFGKPNYHEYYEYQDVYDEYPSSDLLCPAIDCMTVEMFLPCEDSERVYTFIAGSKEGVQCRGCRRCAGNNGGHLGTNGGTNEAQNTDGGIAGVTDDTGKDHQNGAPSGQEGATQKEETQTHTPEATQEKEVKSSEQVTKHEEEQHGEAEGRPPHVGGVSANNVGPSTLTPPPDVKSSQPELSISFSTPDDQSASSIEDSDGRSSDASVVDVGSDDNGEEPSSADDDTASIADDQTESGSQTDDGRESASQTESVSQSYDVTGLTSKPDDVTESTSQKDANESGSIAGDTTTAPRTTVISAGADQYRETTETRQNQHGH